jgi:hypothetical protein
MTPLTATWPRDGSLALASSGNLNIVQPPMLRISASKRIADVVGAVPAEGLSGITQFLDADQIQPTVIQRTRRTRRRCRPRSREWLDRSQRSGRVVVREARVNGDVHGGHTRCGSARTPLDFLTGPVTWFPSHGGIHAIAPTAGPLSPRLAPVDRREADFFALNPMRKRVLQIAALAAFAALLPKLVRPQKVWEPPSGLREPQDRGAAGEVTDITAS